MLAEQFSIAAASYRSRRFSGRRAQMDVYGASSIRNVWHGESGKTQLASAILFVAGAVTRLGKVDDGSTVTNFDEEEIA
jgi:translation elongation factor EF-G